MTCLPCIEKEAMLRAEAYQKLKAKAGEYAKAHGLTKLIIVQTRNFPKFKRATDPDINDFAHLEVLLFD